MLVIFIINISMDYKKVYDSIITRAENRQLEGYGEKHHIIPKCLGGSNRKENLVKLTAKEHWISHLLLVEIYPEYPKLKLAIRMMMVKGINQERKVITSGRQFERLRIQAAKAHSSLMLGVSKAPFTKEHRDNISKAKLGKPGANKGKALTKEHRANIGLASKGRISGDKNPMRNKEVLDKHPALFNNENNPSKIKTQCPHCKTLSGKGNYSRWHGNSCKNKKDE